MRGSVRPAGNHGAAFDASGAYPLIVWQAVGRADSWPPPGLSGALLSLHPDRAELLEEVLLDVLEELIRAADRALSADDPSFGFDDFFLLLAASFIENAGLSQSLEGRDSPSVINASKRLVDRFRALAEAAVSTGHVRGDVSWRDILMLAASTPRRGTCALGVDLVAKTIARWHWWSWTAFERPLPVHVDNLPPKTSRPTLGRASGGGLRQQCSAVPNLDNTQALRRGGRTRSRPPGRRPSHQHVRGTDAAAHCG
jgi:hypothetical protein